VDNIAYILGLGKTVLEMLKLRKEVMPQTAEPETVLPDMEAPPERTALETAEVYAYPLCKCTNPPQVMLQHPNVFGKEDWRCPKCYDGAMEYERGFESGKVDGERQGTKYWFEFDPMAGDPYHCDQGHQNEIERNSEAARTKGDDDGNKFSDPSAEKSFLRYQKAEILKVFRFDPYRFYEHRKPDYYSGYNAGFYPSYQKYLGVGFRRRFYDHYQKGYRQSWD